MELEVQCVYLKRAFSLSGERGGRGVACMIHLTEKQFKIHDIN